VFAEDLPEGGVDPASVRRLAAHPRCRLVALTWVPTNSGLVQDAEAVGEICETAGVPYLVDACQAIGQIPVDPAKLR
jgi:selenocysteine lyase/cysteine desulfurase